MWFWVALLAEHNELGTVRALPSDGIAAGSCCGAPTLCVCRAAALVQAITEGSDSKPRDLSQLLPAPRAVIQSQTTAQLPPSQSNSKGSVFCWLGGRARESRVCLLRPFITAANFCL